MKITNKDVAQKIIDYLHHRITLADVKEFGMSWEDCENFLSRLGYRTQVIVMESSAKATAES